MLAAPRAASASPSEPVSPGRCTWGKRQRLLRAPEFAAFLPPQAPWRAARRWLAMSVIISPLAPRPAPDDLSAGPVRLGLTVSKRQVRRAVARNTVRRVLREAVRLRMVAVEVALLHAQLPGPGLDILLRLKAPLPPADAAGWRTVKAQLRREADSLLDQLLGVLQSGEPAAQLARTARDSLAQSAQGSRAARTPTPGAKAPSGPAEIPK